MSSEHVVAVVLVLQKIAFHLSSVAQQALLPACVAER